MGSGGRKPHAALVIDRYDEDWTRLVWIMLKGCAEILPAGLEHDQAHTTLRARYSSSPHATSWGRLE
jgi:hypothetical protein